MHFFYMFLYGNKKDPERKSNTTNYIFIPWAKDAISVILFTKYFAIFQCLKNNINQF